MGPIYVVREAIPDDVTEIETLLKTRHGKFMKRLSLALLLSNWFSFVKYLVIGIFACYNFGVLQPLSSALMVVPVFMFMEVVYSTVVTRVSMKNTMKSIEKRIVEGIVPEHQIYVVRRIGALAGVMSLKDPIGNNLCLECEFFFCNEGADIARTFVLFHTLRTAVKIAESQRFTMLLFRCCDIFPDLVGAFDSLGFELIMIHRVLILFSCIHMLTFAKVISVPEDNRTSVSVHIPGSASPTTLNSDPGVPIQATSSIHEPRDTESVS